MLLIHEAMDTLDRYIDLNAYPVLRLFWHMFNLIMLLEFVIKLWMLIVRRLPEMLIKVIIPVRFTHSVLIWCFFEYFFLPDSFLFLAWSKLAGRLLLLGFLLSILWLRLRISGFRLRFFLLSLRLFLLALRLCFLLFLGGLRSGDGSCFVQVANGVSRRVEISGCCLLFVLGQLFTLL